MLIKKKSLGMRVFTTNREWVLYECTFCGNTVEQWKYRVKDMQERIGREMNCGCLSAKKKEETLKRKELKKNEARATRSKEQAELDRLKRALWYRWHSMVARCHHPSHKRHKFYGAKGITVCERWKKFKNFAQDMGIPPLKGAQLDRIDNTGGYSPDNVRWATMLENMYNREPKGHPKPVNVSGEKYQSITACAKVLKIKEETVINRCNKKLHGFEWA